MKGTWLTLILTIFCINSSLVVSQQMHSLNQETQFSNYLWKLDLIGVPRDINFINKSEVVVSTHRGVLAKMNIQNGKSVWKRLYNNEIQIYSENKLTLALNQEHHYFDVIDSEKNKLLFSHSFRPVKHQDSSVIKVRLTMNYNAPVVFILETKEFKVFNNEKMVSQLVLADSGEEFKDFMINGDDVVVSCVNKNTQTIDIYKASLKGKKVQFNKTESIDTSAGEVKDVMFSLEYALVVLKNNTYQIFSIKKGKAVLPDYAVLSFQYSNFYVFSAKNKVVLTEKNKNSIVIINLESGESSHAQFASSEGYSSINFVDIESTSLIYNLSVSNNEVSVQEYNLHRKTLEAPSTVKLPEACILTNSFTNFFNDADKTYSIIVCSNQRMYLYDSQNTFSWYRDESLSDIVFTDVIHFETKKLDEREIKLNSIEEFLKKPLHFGLVSDYLTMLQYDLIDIYHRVRKNIEGLIENRVTTLDREWKMFLIAFTKTNTLYIFDAYEGTILYKTSFKNKSLIKINKKVVKGEVLEHHHSDFLIEMIFTENDKYLKFDLNLRNFQILNETLDYDPLDEIKSYVERNPNFDNFKNEISLTPSTSLKGKLLVMKDQVFIVNQENAITAVKISLSNEANPNNKVNLVPVWNIKFPQNHYILDRRTNKVNDLSESAYQSNGKIFYKFLDKNIELILVNAENKSLIINIVKGTSGKILHQGIINAVDFSQSIIADMEENVVVIYYSRKDKVIPRNELFVIEILKRDIEYSIVSLLEKIWNGAETNTTQEQEENNLVFISQTFILPSKVRFFKFSMSRMNVSNKQLVIVFHNNSAYFLDMRYLSPKRPIVKEDKTKTGGVNVIDPVLNNAYTEPEYAVYSPTIMLDDKSLININFNNNYINELTISPTEYESTFVLCSSGLNISCQSIYPSKTFDSLHLQFSHSLIFLILVGAMTLCYFMRKYVKNLEKKNLFIHS